MGDDLLIMTFLHKRGLSHETIKKYISAYRYTLNALGHSTDKLQSPTLTTLEKGVINNLRDPVAQVKKPTIIAMTIPLMKILSHALSLMGIHPLEKQAFFTCANLAFWSSFRIGELLEKNVTSFSSLTSLLGSDVKISLDSKSAAFWLRAAKVAKPEGDVIETWQVDEFPEICPLRSLLKYI